MPSSTELYSLDWFKQRAFASLRKLEEGVWDYSDSLLLYTPTGEEKYESIQQGEDPYQKLITEPENEYLKEIAQEIVAQLPNECEYIDLGPGTAHKEQYLFDAARAMGKHFIYRPVDISQRYLELSAEHARSQKIEAEPIQASFEELPERLGEPTIPRFVSIGLTFGNYLPQVILPLLNRIAGPGGCLFINTHQRDRVNMVEYVQLYQSIAFDLADPKLALLGLEPTMDVAERTVTDGIQVWYTLNRSTDVLEACGIKSGDRLLMLQSMRYTKESLTQIGVMTGNAYTLFDTGKMFIGALLKT